MAEIQHVTKEIAVDAGNNYGTFYHRTIRMRDGSAATCRVNGKCKTWKTRPDDFRLPVKHGWKTCFYITESNAKDWLLRDPTSMEVILEPFKTTDVVELAKVVIEHEDRAPMLADALEEAGYTHDGVFPLSDLRSGRPLTKKIRRLIFFVFATDDCFCDSWSYRSTDKVLKPCESLTCSMHGERNKRQQLIDRENPSDEDVEAAAEFYDRLTNQEVSNVG